MNFKNPIENNKKTNFFCLKAKFLGQQHQQCCDVESLCTPFYTTFTGTWRQNVRIQIVQDQHRQVIGWPPFTVERRGGTREEGRRYNVWDQWMSCKSLDELMTRIGWWRGGGIVTWVTRVAWRNVTTYDWMTWLWWRHKTGTGEVVVLRGSVSVLVTSSVMWHGVTNNQDSRLAQR